MTGPSSEVREHFAGVFHELRGDEVPEERLEAVLDDIAATLEQEAGTGEAEGQPPEEVLAAVEAWAGLASHAIYVYYGPVLGPGAARLAGATVLSGACGRSPASCWTPFVMRRRALVQPRGRSALVSRWECPLALLGNSRMTSLLPPSSGRSGSREGLNGRREDDPVKTAVKKRYERQNIQGVRLIDGPMDPSFVRRRIPDRAEEPFEETNIARLLAAFTLRAKRVKRQWRDLPSL